MERSEIIGTEDLWIYSSAHGLEIDDVIMFTKVSNDTNINIYMAYFVLSVPTTTTRGKVDL